MTRSRLCLVLALALGSAGPAAAEIVIFTTGRTMSVGSHRVEGDRIVLALRGGGEVVCERSLVVRIEPDEIPYPEPPSTAPVSWRLPVESAREDPAQHRAGAQSYDLIVQHMSAAYGVDPKLVHAVITVESAYQTRARSSKGAMGLMQLMPATARQYHVSDPYDPVSNIEAGTRHLRSLLDRFPLTVALAAYNAGEASVRRFGGVPPFPETRSYVARVLELVGR